MRAVEPPFEIDFMENILMAQNMSSVVKGFFILFWKRAKALNDYGRLKCLE